MLNDKLIVKVNVSSAEEAKELLKELEVLKENYVLEITLTISSQASFE